MLIDAVDQVWFCVRIMGRVRVSLRWLLLFTTRQRELAIEHFGIKFDLFTLDSCQCREVDFAFVWAFVAILFPVNGLSLLPFRRSR